MYWPSSVPSNVFARLLFCQPGRLAEDGTAGGISGLLKRDNSGHSREVNRNMAAPRPPRVLLNNDFAIGGTQSEAWVCLWITSIGAGYRWFAFRRWQTSERSIGSKTDCTQGPTLCVQSPFVVSIVRLLLYSYLLAQTGAAVTYTVRN